MLGLINTLKMASRAMQAQQVGVEVTGQNLANSDNKTYSRQQVVLTSTDTINSQGGTQGTGVQVATIQQLRDAFLDTQITNEESVGGYWNASQKNLSNIETQLGESLDATSGSSSTASTTNSLGLSSQLNTLFTDFSSVATDPTSLSNRQVLINDAQTLANIFNGVTAKLSDINTNLNSMISTDVDSANSLLSDIATLNNTILQTEAITGGPANDLRDTREAKLEQLAQLVNITTSTQPNGQITVTNGSATLVSGNTVNATLQAIDPGSGQLQVQASTGDALSLTGGSIQAEMDVRDNDLANLQTGVNTIASELIGQVNTIYGAGYDLNGNSGGAFFTGNDASDIAVSSNLINDPSQFQASANSGATGDNAIALALSQLSSQPIASLNNKTFNQAYNSLVTNLGNAVSSSGDQVTNYQNVSKMLSTQRDSTSGVSMEEEMANLITYQTAYSAASHVISTIDSMFTSLLQIQ